MASLWQHRLSYLRVVSIGGHLFYTVEGVGCYLGHFLTNTAYRVQPFQEAEVPSRKITNNGLYKELRKNWPNFPEEFFDLSVLQLFVCFYTTIKQCLLENWRMQPSALIYLWSSASWKRKKEHEMLIQVWEGVKLLFLRVAVKCADHYTMLHLNLLFLKYCF